MSHYPRSHHHAALPPSFPLPFPSFSTQLVGGYLLGPVLGIGTYGEVRYGYSLSSSCHVALKLIDLNRIGTSAKEIVMNEIKMMKLVQSKHCIKLIEVKQKVELQGEWCSECACTTYTSPLETISPSATLSSSISLSSSSSASATPLCFHCSHPASLHCPSTSRQVMMLIQELGIGGEFFSILSHTGPLPEGAARYYFHQLIEAVESCHRVNVIHRDLKPENMVLDQHFDLKLVDFGLSALRREPRVRPMRHPLDEGELDDDSGYDYRQHVYYDDEDDDDGTCTHHTGVGSIPYAAPESYYRELYGHRPYKGAEADLWSCAVILYVMLTGRPPFIRPLTKTYGSLRRDRHFISLMKGEYPPSVSEEGKSLLISMFRVHPEDRLTIPEIKKHRWFLGDQGDHHSIIKLMNDRSIQCWRKMDKTEMVGLLNTLREEDNEKLIRHSAPINIPTITPTASNPFHLLPVNPLKTLHHHDAIGGDLHAHMGRFLQPLHSLPDSHSVPSSPGPILPLDHHHPLPSPHHQPQLPPHHHHPHRLLPAATQVIRELSGLTLAGPADGTTDTAATTSHQRRVAAGGSVHSPPASSVSAVSALSSSGTYRSFFKSAKAPHSPPLSITAQAALKPTTWRDAPQVHQHTPDCEYQQPSHSLSASRSASGVGADVEDDDISQADEAVNDTGYEVDDSNDEEETQREDSDEAAAQEVKHEEKHAKE